jgi:hypothetical protein
MAIPLHSFHYPFPGNGFWHSHCNFKSHVKSSWHCLILLSLFLQLPLLRLLSATVVLVYSATCRYIPNPLDASVQSQSYLRLAALYRRGTDLQKTRVTYQNAWRGPHRKYCSLYCWEGIFTAPLPSNINPIPACTCVAGVTISWRWRHHIPSKRWYLSAKLYDVVCRKTVFFIVTFLTASIHPRILQCLWILQSMYSFAGFL